MHNKHGDKLEYALHDADRDDVLVIIGHGLTGNMDREMCVVIGNELSKRGWPTLRFSFNGHGNSGGKFEEMTIAKEIDDLQAILDQQRTTQKVAYIGHSMGGAVGALTAAKDDRINVLISLAGMVYTKQFYEQEFSEQEPGNSVMWDKPECPLSQAFKDDLTQIDTVIPATKDIRLPWLFIHGAKDDVVFPNHSEDLHAAIKGKKKLVIHPEAEHLFEEQLGEVVEEIHNWLTSHL